MMVSAANETLLWSTEYTYISVTNPVLLDLGPWPFWALLRVGLPWRPFPSSSALCWHVNKCQKAIPEAGDCQRPLLSTTPAESRVLPCVSPMRGSPCRQGRAVVSSAAGLVGSSSGSALMPVTAPKWSVHLELCASHCENLLSNDCSWAFVHYYTQQCYEQS